MYPLYRYARGIHVGLEVHLRCSLGVLLGGNGLHEVHRRSTCGAVEGQQLRMCGAVVMHIVGDTGAFNYRTYHVWSLMINANHQILPL